jgi:putative DNA primase/helicase
MNAVAEDLRRVKEAVPSIRLVRGDAVTLEPVRWAWRGYLPRGMLTILGGAPGCGKTTIALALAATMTRAGVWPDGSRCATVGDVLIWSGEDAHPVIGARLAAADADMSRVHFVDGVSGGGEDGSFDPGRDMLLLEAAAETLPNLQMLILDPIVSAVAGDSHKNAEVRRALQPVIALAQRTNCAVLGITHFTKGTAGRDPVERITGSLAFAALARLVLVAAKVKVTDDEEPRRVFVRAKSNIGPDDGGFAYSLVRKEVAPEVEGQRVQWGEALEGSAREVLAEAEAEPEDGDDSEDAAELLRTELAMAGTWVPAGAATAPLLAAGFSKKQAWAASKKLGVIRKKGGYQGAWYMRLPGGPDPELPTEPAKDSKKTRKGSKDPNTQRVEPMEPLVPALESLAPGQPATEAPGGADEEAF